MCIIVYGNNMHNIFFCRFTKKVKYLSSVYHDRPVASGDELVHWVEHVIKTRGALHLRSPTLYVSWYKKMYLDLIALAVAAICIVKLIINRLFVAFFKQRMNLVKIKRQ